MKRTVSKPDAAESGGRRGPRPGRSPRTRTSGCRKSRCASWRSKRICCLRSQGEWRGRGPGGLGPAEAPLPRGGTGLALKVKTEEAPPGPVAPSQLRGSLSSSCFFIEKPAALLSPWPGDTWADAKKPSLRVLSGRGLPGATRPE